MNLLLPVSFFLLSAILTNAQLSKDEIDVLNAVLNLECLKAQFYSFSAFGTGLSSSLTKNGPRPVGGKKALLSPSALQLAKDIANDEINHVKLLRDTLGKNAVRCPQVDIGPAFSLAANAALVTTLNPPFDPYGSDVLFYHAAFILEDLTVTAYTTCVKSLNTPESVLAYAGVLATEGYHAGAIRDRLIAIAGQYVFPFAANVTTITNYITLFRDGLGGGKDGYLQPLVPADTKYSTAYARTINEILNIVYIDPEATPGGFFPKGFNGNYR